MVWPFVCMFKTGCLCVVLKRNRWDLLLFTYPLHLASSSLYHLAQVSVVSTSLRTTRQFLLAALQHVPQTFHPIVHLQPAVDTVNQSTDFLIKRLHPVVGPNGPDL